MVSLDQVLLLQQKVESAVAKIAELHQAVAQKDAEIAALRSKCVELTNALSVKTEQFSSFQSDQSKIEEGILKALERLNAVESTVLSVAAQAAQPVQNAIPASNAGTAAVVETAPANAGIAAQPVQPMAAQQNSTQPQVTEPEQPVSPDMTVEEAMKIPDEQHAPVSAESVSEAERPVATAAEPQPPEGNIEPDITFDDAPLSPEQGADSAQGQFDIF